MSAISKVKVLSALHYRIMDFVLAGWKYVDIAKKVGISSQQIYNIRSMITFQDTLAQRRAVLDEKISDNLTDDLSDQEYVSKKLQKGTRAAVDKLCSLVDASTDSIARAAADSLLDRGGFPKLTKTENTTGTIFVLNQEDLQRLEDTIEMDADEDPSKLVKSEQVEPVIDAEFTEK